MLPLLCGALFPLLLWGIGKGKASQEMSAKVDSIRPLGIKASIPAPKMMQKRNTSDQGEIDLFGTNRIKAGVKGENRGKT